MTISISELEAIEKAMTAAPWEWDSDPALIGPPRTEDYGAGPQVVRDRIVETDSGYYGPSDPDRAGIAAARNALPALLAIAKAALSSREAHDSTSSWADHGAHMARCQATDLALDRALAKVRP